MIDIHTHIVYGVDDGPETIDDSIEIIKSAKSNGINEIIFTSHYIEDGYKSNKDVYASRIEEIIKKSHDENINMKFYVGNEIMISPNIVDALKNDEVYALNNSRYVLIELPMLEKVLYVEDVLFKLKSSGYVPIIAHPERYAYVQNDITYVGRLLQLGALLQLNVASVCGVYGPKAKKTAIQLLKLNAYTVAGSDAHSPHMVFDVYSKSIEYIKKKFGNEYFEALTYKNPKSIINNEEIRDVSVSIKARRRWIF